MPSLSAGVVRLLAVFVSGCLTFGASGCGGDGGSSFAIDARGYDRSACPTGDDVRTCPGVLDFEVLPVSSRGEFLVVWRGRYGPNPSSDALYARGFDARDSQARTATARLFGADSGNGDVSYFTTFDVLNGQYVVASQTADHTSGVRGPIEVRRFDRGLRSAGPIRQLDRSELADLVAGPQGRVAVVGLEHDGAAGDSSPRAPRPVTLRVETLDAANSTVSVARRGAGRQNDRSLGAWAARDSASGNVLVAWRPTSRYGPGVPVRFESIPPSVSRLGRGMKAASTARSVPGVEFTCSAVRHDCLLAYPDDAASGVLPDLLGQLVGGRGQRLGAQFAIAPSTRGAIGVGENGSGYSVTWYAGGIAGPTTSTVMSARVGGPRAIGAATRQQLPGDARIAREQTTDTSLLVWKKPRAHDSYLVGRLVP